MASPIFEFVAREIERRTELATLAARGTLRLALKRGGLDARDVTTEQMVVVLDRVMPAELRARGVACPEELCQAISAALRAAHPQVGTARESPEAIFRRLAGGRVGATARGPERAVGAPRSRR